MKINVPTEKLYMKQEGSKKKGILFVTAFDTN